MWHDWQRVAHQAHVYLPIYRKAIERAAWKIPDLEIGRVWRREMALARRNTARRHTANLCGARGGDRLGGAVFLPSASPYRQIKSWTIQLDISTVTHGRAGYHPSQWAKAARERAILEAESRRAKHRAERAPKERRGGPGFGSYNSAGVYLARSGNPPRKR